MSDAGIEIAELIETIALEAPDNWALYAWYALAGTILGIEVWFGLTGHKYLTNVIHEALLHPIKRWIPILVWVAITKHFFFRNFLPKLDPFGLIALGIQGIKYLTQER